jgi:ubiquitin-conjugating enzyme E2 Z
MSDNSPNNETNNKSVTNEDKDKESDERNGKTINNSVNNETNDNKNRKYINNPQFNSQSVITSMASLPVAATPVSSQSKSSAQLNDFFFPNSYRNSSKDFEENKVTNKTTILRIKRDLTEFYASEMSTIHVVPEEDNISRVHALIQGPEGTPYENGFFYFTVIFPVDYPIKPPKVKIMTTGRGTVGFNPNLYANGFVCLSILNTWSGPQWSPVMNLTSVLLSIQSLMNEEPYYNEPGREFLKKSPKNQKFMSNANRYYSDVSQCSQQYNENIRHETIRVAVLDMIENTFDSKTMPQPLKDIMVESFKANYYFYEDLVSDKIAKQSQKDSNSNNNSNKTEAKSKANNERISPPISPSLSMNSLIPPKKMKASDGELFEDSFYSTLSPNTTAKGSTFNTSNTMNSWRLHQLEMKQMLLKQKIQYLKNISKQEQNLLQKDINPSQTSQTITTEQLENSLKQIPNESQSNPVSTDSKEPKTSHSLIGEMLDQSVSNSSSSTASPLYHLMKKPSIGVSYHSLANADQNMDLEVDDLTFPIMSYRRRNLSFNDWTTLLKRFQALKLKYKIADKPKPEEKEISDSSQVNPTQETTAPSTSTAGAYSAIASNYMKSPPGIRNTKEQELNVEDIINDADYYMGANEDEEYDLEYESESDAEDDN